MEPIDRRITAPQLLAMRASENAAQKIAELLGVDGMATRLAAHTIAEIEEFVATGDATAAAQLVHAAMVRQQRSVVK
jgi:hypothetical protein